MKAKRFDIFGMVCPACPKALEIKLEQIPGVTSAEADLSRGTTTVVYDADVTDEVSIAEEIHRSGFGVRVTLQPPSVSGRQPGGRWKLARL